MNELILDNKRFRPTGIRNYWVSEYGDIINMDTNKFLKPFTCHFGHKRIELKIAPGVPKKFFIHRLVYQAFIGNLIDGLVIEHLDSNPANNHYTNLKQSTQKENIHTAMEFGSFGHANDKEIVISNIEGTINGKFLKFDSIKNCENYIGSNADCISRLKRTPIFYKNYEIIESQSTIETINFMNHEVYNGVEYDRGAIPLVTFL